MIDNRINDPWEVGETVLFGGTVNDLPDGADPTDYTMVFKIWNSTTLLDTMTATLDADSNYEISHTLAEGVTAGTRVTVYVYIIWTDTTVLFNRLGKFEKTIEASKYSG